MDVRGSFSHKEKSVSRLPPAVNQKRSKVKHELVPVIDKMKGPTLTDAFKKDLKKKVLALYDQFDGGLKKSLKAGAEAKTDKDAVLAISQAHKTATDYKKKTAAARAEWGMSASSVAKRIETALDNIIEACDSTLEALAAK